MTRYVIFGATGTLGNELIRQLIDTECEITCVSRDELKQKETRARFGYNPKLKFILGDIRDRDHVFRLCKDKDVCFNVAALKHVEILQENPLESKKTNIDGAINIADACEYLNVKNCIFFSTDKACKPINAYGACKFFAEIYYLSRNQHVSNTKFSVYRWGNVIGSRGSALHGFIDTLKNEKKAYLTHPDMTRFFIRIEEAVRFALATYKNAYRDKVMVPKMRSLRILELIHAVAKAMKLKSYDIVETEIRAGEKIHEDINFDFNSDNSPRLTSTEVDELIKGFV